MLWPSWGPHGTLMAGKLQRWAQHPPAVLTQRHEAGKALQAQLHPVPARKGPEQPWGTPQAWGPWEQLPGQCLLPVLLLCLPRALFRLSDGETEARSCAQRAALPSGPLLSGTGVPGGLSPPRPHCPTDGGSLAGPRPCLSPGRWRQAPAGGGRRPGEPGELWANGGSCAGPRWAARGCAGRCGAGLGNAGLHWAVLGCADPWRIMLDCAGKSWTVLERAGLCCASLGCAGP